MEAYGAWGEKNMYGKKVQGTIRSTFAIDAEGVLTFVKYRVGTPQAHRAAAGEARPLNRS